MASKKVLFLITKGSPFGGAQKYVYDLATNAPEGFEAMVACGEGDALPNALIEKGVRTVTIPHLVREVSFFDEFKVCADLVKLMREEKPDIIHLNSSKIGGIGAVAARIAAWFTRDYSNKIIFTSHGWGFNERHRSFISRTFYWLSHWVSLLLVHEVIAVSERTKKDVSNMPFIPGKIRVIHNGISNFKTKTKKEARLILSGEEQSKKLIILSISELNKNKGLDVALHGLARLPHEIRENMIYCIAGTGEEENNLKELAENLGLSLRVRFLGFVPNAKELLSGADIFLFPSRNENLPFAVLEAGLAGQAIIATSVGGIPEIIDDMQNGILVHRRNPREIAEGIQYFTQNPDKAKLFKGKIKEKVKTNFSLEKMIAETYSRYL